VERLAAAPSCGNERESERETKEILKEEMIREKIDNSCRRQSTIEMKPVGVVPRRSAVPFGKEKLGAQRKGRIQKS